MQLSLKNARIISLGFSLLELLITIAIIGILAAVGTFFYTGHLQKSRRAEAIHALYALQLAESRWRSNNTTYGTLAQVGTGLYVASGGINTTLSGRYSLTITGNTATGYTAQAQALGAQASDKESGVSCATLTLTVSGGQTTLSPSVCFIQ